MGYSEGYSSSTPIVENKVTRLPEAPYDVALFSKLLTYEDTIVKAVTAYDALRKEGASKQAMFTDPIFSPFLNKTPADSAIITTIYGLMKTSKEPIIVAKLQKIDESRRQDAAKAGDLMENGFRKSTIYFNAQLLDYARGFMHNEKTKPASYFNLKDKIQPVAPEIRRLPEQKEKIVVANEHPKVSWEKQSQLAVEQQAQQEYAKGIGTRSEQHLAMDEYCKQHLTARHGNLCNTWAEERLKATDKNITAAAAASIMDNCNRAFNEKIRDMYSEMYGKKIDASKGVVPAPRTNTEAVPLFPAKERPMRKESGLPSILSPKTPDAPPAKPMKVPAVSDAQKAPVQMDVKRSDRKVESVTKTTTTNAAGETVVKEKTTYEYAQVINEDFLETLKKKYPDYMDKECTLDAQGTTMKKAMSYIKDSTYLMKLAEKGPLDPALIPLSEGAKKEINLIFAEIFGRLDISKDPIQDLNWKMIYLNGVFRYSGNWGLAKVLVKDKVTGEFRESNPIIDLMRKTGKLPPLKTEVQPPSGKPLTPTIESKEKELPFGQKRYHDAALITSCSLTPENIAALQKNMTRGEKMKPITIDAGVDGRPVRERSQAKVHDAFMASNTYCTRTHPELQQLRQTILQKAQYNTYKNAAAGPRYNMELLAARAAASLIRMHEDVIRPHAIRIDKTTGKEILSPEQQGIFLSNALVKISIGNLTRGSRKTGTDEALKEDRYTQVG